MLWKHIFLCISRQHNVRALVGNPLAMSEVYLCCECLTNHHPVLDGMPFVPFHQRVVITHFVPSKDIYIYIQVYFLFCVDMNFQCTLYVFEIDLGVAHSPEVDWMKV